MDWEPSDKGEQFLISRFLIALLDKSAERTRTSASGPGPSYSGFTFGWDLLNAGHT